MIASISKGRGMRGLLSYLIGNPSSQRGLRVAGNMGGKTIRELAAEFGLIRKMRPTLGRAVAHLSISLPPEDRHPKAGEWSVIAEAFVSGLGFTDCPWVAFEHTDTAHPHIHLAISRIRADGSVVADAGDFRRAQKISRDLEKLHGLISVSSQKKTTPRRQKMENKADLLIQEAEPEIDPETSRFSRSEVQAETAWGESIFDGYEDMTISSPQSGAARFLPEQFYQGTVGSELDRVVKTQSGAVLYLKPNGMIRDEGGKLGAFFLDDEHAAELLIDLSEAKGWKEISLAGPDLFVKKSMELALSRGLKIRPKDKRQQALLDEIIFAQTAITGFSKAKIPEAPLPLIPSMKTKLANLRTDEKKKGGGSGSSSQKPATATTKKPWKGR